MISGTTPLVIAGDRLLAQRRERDDAVLDLVAARLLVIGEDFFEGDILLFGEALHPPQLRGRRRRVGDMGPRQGAGGGEAERTVKQRTSR